MATGRRRSRIAILASYVADLNVVSVPMSKAQGPGRVEAEGGRGGTGTGTGAGSRLTSGGLLSQVQGPSDRPSWLQTWLPAPPFAQ